MDRIEKATLEPLVAGRHVGHVELAVLEPRRKACTTIFDDADFDTRMAPAMSCEKTGKQRLDHGRSRADPDLAGMPAFQRARTFAECIGFGQDLASPPKQVFAFRRQSDAAADAIE